MTVPKLMCGFVCVILRLAVLIELPLVTYGQTDRHIAIACTAVAQRPSVKRLQLTAVVGSVFVI